MAITVKHKFVSAIPDAGDPTIVQPSNWNDDHQLTGTVPIANGGTGAATANDGFNALAPSQTGNSGKYLTTDGTNTSWATNPLGTVTSVAATVPSFLSVSGSPITTSGTLALTYSGTALPVANGGTGVTASSGANSVVLRDANANITTNCLFEGFSTQSASGTTIVLTASSVQNWQITGSGGQTIKLPDATTLPNGAIFTFNNNQSSGTIVVQNNSSTTIATINSGGYVTVILLSNSIAAGSWDKHDSTPSNVSWSTNTLDYAGSITSATWNGNTVAVNRGGTGATTLTGYVKGSGTSALTAASTIPTTDLSGTVTNAQLANSAITINGNSTSLGGSVSVGTVTSVAATAGTGISVTGSPITSSGTLNITNTAPDQTVVLTAGTGISTSGTYPNFTITNTSPSSGGTVTSVASGTGLTGGPITSSGTLSIANTGVTAGTYGSAAVIPVIAVNSQGQITSISTQPTNAPAYQGTWNASTNTPTLISSVGVAGYYYVVSVAGTTTLNGVSNWNVGDWAIYENGAWQKIAGSSSESFTNLTTTNLAVTGLTGYMYANNTTGNVTASSTIPNAGLANSAITINGTSTSLGGSINVGTVTSVTGTSPVVSSGGTTPAISMAAATTSVSGYLTSTDWNTFNNKQPAGTYVTSVSATSPVTSSGGTTPTIAMPAATTSVSGYLTSTDWNTFNNKGSGTVTSVSGTTGRITSTGGATPVIDLASGVATAGTTGSSTLIPVVTIDTYGRVTSITTASNPQGTVTSVTGTAPVVSSGGATPAISMAAATGSVNGYLTSTDWTTFNNKAASFTYTSNYIPYGQGTTTPNQASNFTFDGTTQTAPIQRASNGIVVNSKTVSASYTIASGDSAMSAGPMTVASGQTVTISSGSRWVVL
jgi:hypothetical protein